MSLPVAENMKDVRAVEAALQKEIDSVKSGMRTTFIGTGILAVVMLSYLTWIYTSINILLDERGLAGQAQVYVRKTMPQLDGRVKEAMLTGLPRAIDRGFDIANARVPDLGEFLTDYVDQKIEKAFRTVDVKLDRELDSRMYAVLKEAVNEKIKHVANHEKRSELEDKLVQEMEEHYRQGAMSKFLPEIFERWTNVRTMDAVGVFKDRLQAFDIELQMLCNTPKSKLSQADRERRQMVLCLTAYLESLFAEEGSRIVERIMTVLEASPKMMQVHFKKLKQRK